MFNTFIYFIVALLLWSTYQPSPQPALSPFQSLCCYLLLFILLFLIAKVRFLRLDARMSLLDRRLRDHHLTRTVTTLSLLSLFFTAIDIYLFEVTTLLLDFQPFKALPVFKALFILLTLSSFFAIVWFLSHSLREKIYYSKATRGVHIFHQLSFAVPLILPWFVMTGLSDLIMILPFDGARRFLLSPAGEITYLVVILLTLTVAGPGVVQKLWRCAPLEAGPDRTRIEALLKHARLEYQEILSWPIFGGMMMTAGIMGIVKRFRYILVTPALLALLSPDEIDAVVAHEIGHAKRRHLLFYLMFFIGYMIFISIVWEPLIHLLFYSKTALFLFEKSGLNQGSLLPLGLSMAAVAIFLVYFRVIFGYFMRNFERQADIYVYELMENASHLISTFAKIVSTSGQSPDTPNWHHFSISERVQFLKACEKDRSHIHRHNTKVRNSLILYVALLLIVTTATAIFLKPGMGRSTPPTLPDISVLNQLYPHPDNADLFILIGDVHFQTKEYGKALLSYEEALKREPSNVRALNNLAWLLATCDDRSIIDPARALELSKKAAALEPAPYVLDTLAESYFINGMVDEAIAAEQRAIEGNPEEKSHYEAQLEKFMKSFSSQSSG